MAAERGSYGRVSTDEALPGSPHSSIGTGDEVDAGLLLPDAAPRAHDSHKNSLDQSDAANPGRWWLPLQATPLSIAVICISCVVIAWSWHSHSSTPSSASAASRCRTHAQPGFWVVPRLVYMTLSRSSDCQLQPFAFQLDRLTARSRNVSHRLPHPSDRGEWFKDNSERIANGSKRFHIFWPDKLRALNDTYVLPPGWSADSIAEWTDSEVDLSWLRNRVFVLLGDSTDKHVVETVCQQTHQFSINLTTELLGLQGVQDVGRAYNPRYCSLDELNFKLIYIHHFGVTQVYSMAATRPQWSANFSVRTLLPAVLDYFHLRLSDVDLIEFESGLWDMNQKGAGYVVSAQLLMAHWYPLMQSELVQPLLALYADTPRDERPLLVLRTLFPSKWGDAKNEHFATINELSRWTAAEHASDVELLDVAQWLAEKQSWCFDGHHMPLEVQLNHANLLLNMVYDRRVRQAGTSSDSAEEAHSGNSSG